MNTLETDNGVTLTYEQIRQAMKGKPFDMSMTGDDAEAVKRAVNQGIDAHLEAAYIRERGDSYEWSGDRRVKRLNCTISPESFPTLVRRLFEDDDECANRLASDMLCVLGFDEYGKWEERED